MTTATSPTWSTGATPTFAVPGLLDALEAAPVEAFDDLDFGLITMDRAAAVIGYNRFEAERFQIPPAKVLGRHFFAEIAPCTNNYLVAGRYTDSADLDEELDYVFTLRMTPTPVRLRLLVRQASARQYLAVRER